MGATVFAVRQYFVLIKNKTKEFIIKHKRKLVISISALLLVCHFGLYAHAKKEYNKILDKIILVNGDSILFRYSVTSIPPFYIGGGGYVKYEVTRGDIEQTGFLTSYRYDSPDDVYLEYEKQANGDILVKCSKTNETGWIFRKEADGKYTVIDSRKKPI